MLGRMPRLVLVRDVGEAQSQHLRAVDVLQ